MKNYEAIIDALKAGETLIHDSGNKVEMNKLGDLIPMSYTPAFNQPKDWQVYKEPKWYENIPDGGVLCHVADNKLDNFIEVVRAYTNSKFYSLNINENEYWLNATPLTKQEIQAFMENAPDEL